jgi:hypothetical protein
MPKQKKKDRNKWQVLMNILKMQEISQLAKELQV